MTNLDSLFGENSIPITCPVCSQEFGISFSDIDTAVTCPNCSNEFKIVLSESSKESFENSESNAKELLDTLEDLKETLKNL